MEIYPKEFKIECGIEEINIIHKALTILKNDVMKSDGYSKGYLEKVNKILEETRKYW